MSAPEQRGLRPDRAPRPCPRPPAPLKPPPGLSLPSAAAPWSWSPSGSSPCSGGPPPTRPWRGTGRPTWTTRPCCRWTAPYRRHTTVSTGNAVPCPGRVTAKGSGICSVVGGGSGPRAVSAAEPEASDASRKAWPRSLCPLAPLAPFEVLAEGREGIPWDFLLCSVPILNQILNYHLQCPTHKASLC